MKKLRKFLKKSGLHMPTGCQPYLWKCFGENCVISDLITNNQDPRDAVIDVVYSNINIPRVYEITVMFNDITFIYIEPTCKRAYLDEAESKNIDINGSSNVYDVDDYIPTHYCTYEQILRVIAIREHREYFQDNDFDYELEEEDDFFDNYELKDDEAQNGEWPFPIVDTSTNEIKWSDTIKPYEVVLTLDLSYTIDASSGKNAVDIAKQKLVDQIDVRPMNFLLTNVTLNNGEV